MAQELGNEGGTRETSSLFRHKPPGATFVQSLSLSVPPFPSCGGETSTARSDSAVMGDIGIPKVEKIIQ